LSLPICTAVRGAGNEFVLACDMRFAARETMWPLSCGTEPLFIAPALVQLTFAQGAHLVHEDQRVEMVLLPIGDGLTLTHKIA